MATEEEIKRSNVVKVVSAIVFLLGLFVGYKVNGKFGLAMLIIGFLGFLIGTFFIGFW